MTQSTDRKIEIDQQAILRQLGVSDLDIPTDLLRQALTHKSLQLDKSFQAWPDNERLEYLGDAIIKASISQWLYCRFPSFSEGRMSQIRSYVVSDQALAKAAYRLGLAQHIILGQGERASGGHVRESILANVFEAVCGAVFLSSDFNTAASMIIALVQQELTAARRGKSREVLNYKALLQEYTQSEYKCLPEYHVIQAEGPDHDRLFTVEVVLQGKNIGTGRGRTKKKAEQVGASEAMKHLHLLPESEEP